MFALSFLGLLACGASTPKQVSLAPSYALHEESDCASKACNVRPEQETREINPCTIGMIWVHGSRCTKIIEHCIEWKDKPSTFARCQKYAPSTCASRQYEAMNFCIDKYELHGEDQIPYGDLSWIKTKDICEGQGKRLCSEQEWGFAASGEEMLPYIWGLEFRNDFCNMERKPALCNGKLCDYREKITAYPNCVSPFLVQDMTGSVDEWVEVPRYSHSRAQRITMRSALMGGHYLHGRHRTLVKTTDHGEEFTNSPSIGGRCCSAVSE